MSFTADPPTGAPATIREILIRAKAPLSFAALAKQSKFPSDVLRRVLGAEECRHRIFRWPDARRQQRFWSIAAAEYARTQIIETATECALPAGELAKQARKRAHGYPDKLVRSLVQQLLKDKELRKYPAFGRESSPIGRAGHPAAYAEAARRFKEKIDAKVRAEGGSAGSADVPAEILAAMHALEPSASAPVSVRELRAALPAIGKREFDAAALALWSGQRVFLSRHDYPQSLSVEERDLLIDGGEGSYYVAITASAQ
jgi:hypothetical protein